VRIENSNLRVELSSDFQSKAWPGLLMLWTMAIPQIMTLSHGQWSSRPTVANGHGQYQKTGIIEYNVVVYGLLRGLNN